MRICPVCGKLNPASSHNCDVCGAPLGSAPISDHLDSGRPSGATSGPICPVCRRGNRSESAFCAYCGYRLKSSAAPYVLPQATAHHGAVPPTTPMPPADGSGNLPAGLVLKRRYRILRKVAQGGMGAVYESVDVFAPPGTRWAVKEMSLAALAPQERPQAMADFRREAHMLHTLRHPNLPTVVETFEEMARHFLVMEFIPGRTLLNVLDNTAGYLPEDRVMAWARQLFDVLNYLHSQDPPIVYRDVKPANVMLFESTERIKLIDFGIARFHRQGKAQDTEAFGTAGYAPPEQYGKGQTDQRSDVYALGATLHHLVTKHDPSLNPFNWLPARRLNPHVSPALENALTVATSLDPTRRFQTVAEFAGALGLFLPAPQPQRIVVGNGRTAAQPQPPLAAPVPAPVPAPTPAPAPAKSTPSRRKQSAAPKPAAPRKSTAPAAPLISAAAPIPVAMSSNSAATATEIHRPTNTGFVAAPPAPAPAPTAPSKDGKQSGPQPQLVVTEPVLDMGEARWNTRLARKINLKSQGGAMKGMVLATQPWIAYNPQHFQGQAVTVEVKVKRRQLRFGRVQLHVPNLFAIIWARARRMLPLFLVWFWLLLLVTSSLGRNLLLGVAGVFGGLLVLEALMWLWAQHVRILVPAEKLNTGKLMVKSSGGDQTIEVKVLARPSWLQKSAGWSVALLLFVAEVALVTWGILALVGVNLPVPSL
jgi:serine/threonine protein kinase